MMSLWLHYYAKICLWQVNKPLQKALALEVMLLRDTMTLEIRWKRFLEDLLPVLSHTSSNNRCLLGMLWLHYKVTWYQSHWQNNHFGTLSKKKKTKWLSINKRGRIIGVKFSQDYIKVSHSNELVFDSDMWYNVIIASYSYYEDIGINENRITFSKMLERAWMSTWRLPLYTSHFI